MVPNEILHDNIASELSLHREQGKEKQGKKIILSATYFDRNIICERESLLYFVTAYQLTSLISNFSFGSQSGIETESRDFRASAEGSTSVDPSVCYVVLVPARLHRVQRSRPYVPI